MVIEVVYDQVVVGSMTIRWENIMGLVGATLAELASKKTGPWCEISAAAYVAGTTTRFFFFRIIEARTGILPANLTDPVRPSNGTFAKDFGHLSEVVGSS